MKLRLHTEPGGIKNSIFSIFFFFLQGILYLGIPKEIKINLDPGEDSDQNRSSSLIQSKKLQIMEQIKQIEEPNFQTHATIPTDEACPERTELMKNKQTTCHLEHLTLNTSSYTFLYVPMFFRSCSLPLSLSHSRVHVCTHVIAVCIIFTQATYILYHNPRTRVLLIQ